MKSHAQSNLTTWLERADTLSADSWEKHYYDGKRAIVGHSEFLKWSISGFACTRGPEGRAFQCDLYYDGIKVGDANQSGWGGPDHINIYGSLESQQSWNELCNVCCEAGWGPREVGSAVLDMIMVKCGKLV